MVVRAEQIEVFRAASEKDFAEKAAQGLRDFFPKHTAFMGAAAVSEIVRLGIARARDFRFKSERGIQTYLSLMVYFGSEFHRDPQYAWMRALLDDAPASPEKARIDGIIKATGDYSAAVAGLNHEHIDKALANLLSRGPAIVTGLQPSLTQEHVESLLHQSYPEKAAHLAPPGLTRLVRHARATTQRHGLARDEPVILFSILMLFLGTFADEDPQFGWIARTLTESRGEPEAHRLTTLVDVCFERLNAWLTAT